MAHDPATVRRSAYQAGPRNRKFLRRVRALVRRDGGLRCRHCGATEELTIDHIRPVSKGGSGVLANLQLLCSGCNSAKGNSWDGVSGEGKRLR
jgi:5-methylcytosine-specific restriction endonuclease McrA